MRKIILGALVAAPLALVASPAGATVHTDPCPGQHVQVWSEVGNSGAGQATNHFVCGTPGGPGPKGDTGPQGPKGEPGKDGKDGTASTVPGPAGTDGKDGAAGTDGLNGTDGVDGLPGLPGAPGVNGVDGKDGAQGPKGDEGVAGENGGPGRPGMRGVEGMRGVAGKDGITKTIIVHADGTEEIVEALPKTGGGDSWALGLAGLGVLAGGAALVWAYRRRS